MSINERKAVAQAAKLTMLAERFGRGNSSGIEPVDLRVLVLPDAAEQVSAGGIIIPDKTQEKQQYAVTKGTLIAAGANAFREWGEGNAPKIGSHIVIAQYAGANIEGSDGVKYRIMNDADVCAVLEDAQ